MVCACHCSFRRESESEANWRASCSSAWAQTSQHWASTDRGSGPAADSRDRDEQPLPRDISFWSGGWGGPALGDRQCAVKICFLLWCFVISFMRSPHLLMMYISFLLAICFTTVVRDCVLLPVFTWCCGQDGHWWDDRQTLINWAALYPGVKVILQGNCRLVAYRKLETNHWHSTYLPIWEHPLRTSTREGGGYHNGDTGEGQS